MDRPILQVFTRFLINYLSVAVSINLNYLVDINQYLCFPLFTFSLKYFIKPIICPFWLLLIEVMQYSRSFTPIGTIPPQ